MRGIKKISIRIGFSFVVCCIAAKSYAFDAPSNLPSKRRQLFEMMQFTTAFKDHGIANAVALQMAKENFRRFGMMSKCSAISENSADGMLSEKFRLAVEQTAANTRVLLVGTNSENFTYLAGAPMWAFDQLTDQELDAFLRNRNTDAADEALAAIARSAFLQSFDRLSYDVGARKPEPAAVIWLKEYFRREGGLDTLEELIAELVPNAAENFKRVGSFSQHSPSDAPWLNELVVQIRDASKVLAERLFARNSAKTQLLASVLMLQRPFMLLNSAELHETLSQKSLSRDSVGLLLIRPETLTPLDGVVMQRAIAGVAAAYPEPADFDQMLWSLGPKQMVGKLPADFCSPDQRK